MLQRTLTLIAGILIGLPAWATTPGTDLIDARSVGMGGALRSLASPTAAPQLNPAALGPVRGFFAGTSYATRRLDAFDALALTVVDNVTSPMGGALQYMRIQGEEERENLSLSLSHGKGGLWWGFTGRYVHGRRRGGGEWHDVITGDAGILFERPTGTRIAVVGYDLIDTSLDTIEKRVALGVSQTALSSWTLALDLVRNLERDLSRGVDAHMGAEYAKEGSAWSLRFGQMWIGRSGKDHASVGVGWQRRNLRAGYAVQKARQRDNEYLHVFSLDGSF